MQQYQPEDAVRTVVAYAPFISVITAVVTIGFGILTIGPLVFWMSYLLN